MRVLVPARMQEEASLYLTDFTGRGVIIEEDNVPAGGVVIRGYFRPEEYGAWQRQELQDYLKRLGAYELYPLGLEIRQVAEEDWAEAWKAHFKPMKLTDHLVVRPPWEEYAAQAGRDGDYHLSRHGLRHRPPLQHAVVPSGPGAGVGPGPAPRPPTPGRCWTWAPAPGFWPWPRPAWGPKWWPSTWTRRRWRRRWKTCV